MHVAGDGHCQYMSVIESLRAANYIEYFDVPMLRRRVHDEILSNIEHYSEFMQGIDTSPDGYIESILGNQWGDEVTLTAIAYALNIRIPVYEFSCNSQYVHTV